MRLQVLPVSYGAWRPINGWALAILVYARLFLSHGSETIFKTHFLFRGSVLMDYSRIASKATYHKCIRDLDGYGYIRYQPSYHPKKGSLVYWPDGLK
ncbi:MAG TPA: hypothetical protein VIM89_12005 [Mucilaginibacter sp.]